MIRPRVKYIHNSPDRVSAIGMKCGRFGAGWQWAVGFEAGNLSRKRGCIMIHLLVAYVMISWGER